MVVTSPGRDAGWERAPPDHARRSRALAHLARRSPAGAARGWDGGHVDHVVESPQRVLNLVDGNGRAVRIGAERRRAGNGVDVRSPVGQQLALASESQDRIADDLAWLEETDQVAVCNKGIGGHVDER